MTETAEASYEFCALCGEITIGDEQHICTPFRYGDPQMVQLVRITDVLERISGQLEKLIVIVEHEST